MIERSRDTSAPPLAVRGLKVGFRTADGFRLAVDDVSFELGHRERLALIGESGAGKTVTALSVCGLLEGNPGLFAGRVELSGNDIYHGLGAISRTRPARGAIQVSKNQAAFSRILRDQVIPRVQESIAYVFQEPKETLDPLLTVERQLHHTLERRNGCISAGRKVDDAKKLLTDLKLDPADTLPKYPHELAGGMAQRVGVALALAGRPSILIADEPTSSLDTITQKKTADVLRDLATDPERGLSLLLITHNLRLAAYLAQRILVMYQGRIVESISCADLMNDATRIHPYTAHLLSTSNELHGAGRWGPIPDGLAVGAPSPASKQSPETGVAAPGCPFQSVCHLSRSMPGLQKRCKDEAPELRQLGDEHSIRCWGR